MTNAPDQQTVRDYAERYARHHLANIDHGDILDEMLCDERFAHLMTGNEDRDIATLDPIAAEIKDVAKAAALSWPDEQPAAEHAYTDSHSPWSQWLTDQLLDHEWLASDLAKASGGVFETKQVARWLHSQDVPEPWAAVLVAGAFDASVIDALRAAEHGVLVDAVLEEATQPTAEQDGDGEAARTFLADLRENITSYHQPIPGEPGHCTCGRASGCDRDAEDLASIDLLHDALNAVATGNAEQNGDVQRVAASMAASRLQVVLDYRAVHGRESTDFADVDVCAVLASREMWQRMARRRSADRIAALDARDADGSAS